MFAALDAIKAALTIISNTGLKYIRTYGLDKVVTIAQQFFPHLKICIGVYESSVDHDNPDNPHSTRAQLIRAVSLANTHANVAAVIVGNECLKDDAQAADHWVSAQTLLTDLAYVRDQLSPARRDQVVLTTGLTFAAAHGDTSDNGGIIRDQLKATPDNIDVWLINIYPFYKPGGIVCTKSAIENNLNWNSAEFNAIYSSTGRPVMIGEIGWPSAGSNYGLSVPGVENQKNHTRIAYQWLKDHQWSGFIFEMFDQPWKIAEGDIGSHWGLYDKDGQEKWNGFPWQHHLLPVLSLLLLR
jgi:exo-beta-1,3-glucanase (GH17 family)